MRTFAWALPLLVLVSCTPGAGGGDEPQPPAVRIEVAAGPFLYGATEDDFAAFLAGAMVGYPGMIERMREQLDIPPRQERLGTFYIDEFEVTNRQFRAFLSASGYQPENDTDYLRDWAEGTYPDWATDFPVNWVSQRDAAAYCEWAGGRLPTELEWEKAARGADGRPLPWGRELTAEHGNLGTEQLEPVGNRALDRSPYGVFDMGGNAAELTSSRSGPEENAWVVTRGGSFKASPREAAAFHRSLSMKPDTRRQHVGFRCAYLNPADN